MTAQTNALLDAALALPERERALLADQLWDSLSPDEDGMTDDQFYAELQRRDAELEKDPSAAIPWFELEKEE
jgi:putative addiction module component (TIGR02574 family)